MNIPILSKLGAAICRPFYAYAAKSKADAEARKQAHEAALQKAREDLDKEIEDRHKAIVEKYNKLRASLANCGINAITYLSEATDSTTAVFYFPYDGKIYRVKFNYKGGIVKFEKL